MSLLAALLPLADAVTEGKKVVTGMLIVGLIFIGVIAVGETVHWLRRRRATSHTTAVARTPSSSQAAPETNIPCMTATSAGSVDCIAGARLCKQRSGPVKCPAPDPFGIAGCPLGRCGISHPGW